MKFILAIDQGTTGTRAYLFDGRARVVATRYEEFKQYFPQPGWVEHDAEEIWASTVSVVKKALKAAKIPPASLAAIGITNQRETTVLWDRTTGKPVHKAIVWQCRRTADICKGLVKHTAVFKKNTGLVLDPYFSGTKVQWLLDHVKGARAKARNNQLCFGTIDSWLIYKLTGGDAHVTDPTNASRTLLFNIRNLKWDANLCRLLNVPPSVLPKVQHSGSVFGSTAKVIPGLPAGIPIASVLGDQQAALYGQGCFEAGTIKNTYGTGCFMVLNTGKNLIYSKEGLLTTVASSYKGEPVYALEGAIFIAGAVVQWLRDQLKIIKKAAETEKAVKDLKSTDGVYFVPAFVGLGAPYWDAGAKGMITGLTRGTTDKHIIRAALESMAYQTRDVFDSMKKDSGKNIRELRVDGGACQNNFLMRFQADMLGTRIVRPKNVDSTAFGAALLAGVTVGVWKQKKELESLLTKDRVFAPRMKAARRAQLYAGWQQAVHQVQART